MKKFLILLLIIAIGSGYYFREDIKIMIRPKPIFEGDTSNTRQVSIPIDGVNYVISIDADNDLIKTNEENMWIYTHTTIMLTKVPVSGYVYKDKVYYNTNEIYRNINGTYVVVTDDRNYLNAPLDSLTNLESYTVKPKLLKKNKLSTLPDYEVKDPFELVNYDIVVPMNYSLLDGLTNYFQVVTNDSYLTSHVKYGDYDSIKQLVLNKLASSDNETIKYYEKDNIFLAKTSNRIVGIRYVNINTQVIVACKGNTYTDFAYATLFGLK